MHNKTTFIKTIKESLSIYNKVRKPWPFKICQISGDQEAIKIYFSFLHMSIFEHFMIVFIYFYLCKGQIYICKQSEYEYHNLFAKCELYSNNINKNKL